MKQSTRLQPICDFKKREEDEAAKKLAKATQELFQQQQRLLELESYRAEYGQQFTILGSSGMSAQKLREFQGFVHKLNTVVDQQKIAIENLQHDYENTKRQWLAARNRTSALNKVQTQYQEREQKVEEKKLQKEQDDRNNRRLSL